MGKRLLLATILIAFAITGCSHKNEDEHAVNTKAKQESEDTVTDASLMDNADEQLDDDETVTANTNPESTSSEMEYVFPIDLDAFTVFGQTIEDTLMMDQNSFNSVLETYGIESDVDSLYYNGDENYIMYIVNKGYEFAISSPGEALFHEGKTDDNSEHSEIVVFFRDTTPRCAEGYPPQDITFDKLYDELKCDDFIANSDSQEFDKNGNGHATIGDYRLDLRRVMTDDSGEKINIRYSIHGYECMGNEYNLTCSFNFSEQGDLYSVCYSLREGDFVSGSSLLMY